MDTSYFRRYGYLELIINMGITNVPDLGSYWRKSCSSSIPFFSDLFTRNRFELLIWMLHVSSVPVSQTQKRLDKVRVLLEALINKFKVHMKPSFDETMIGYLAKGCMVPYRASDNYS